MLPAKLAPRYLSKINPARRRVRKSGHLESNRGPFDCRRTLQSDALTTALYPAVNTHRYLPPRLRQRCLMEALLVLTPNARHRGQHRRRPLPPTAPRIPRKCRHRSHSGLSASRAGAVTQAFLSLVLAGRFPTFLPAVPVLYLHWATAKNI